VLASVVALGSGVTAFSAHAQSTGEPTAEDVASATQLYTDGKELRDKGDLVASLEKLRAAHALVETPITALELARTYEMTGKLVEAREVAASIARIPPRRNESEKSLSARGEAETMARALKPRLAQITVRVTPLQEKPPRLIVDDVTVPPAAASAERILNPGKHVVVVRSDVSEARAEIAIAEGERREVTIDLGPREPRGEPLAPARSTRSPLVYVGFATAGAGVLVGSVTGLITLSKASSVKNTCTGLSCPASSQNDLNTANTLATISTVSFVTGGVGAAIAVAGLLLGGSTAAPRAPSTANHGGWVSPWLGAGVAGVEGAF
jgi:hypothetical protein